MLAFTSLTSVLCALGCETGLGDLGACRHLDSCTSICCVHHDRHGSCCDGSCWHKIGENQCSFDPKGSVNMDPVV